MKLARTDIGRVMRFLARGEAKVAAAARRQDALLTNAAGTIGAPRDVLSGLMRRGLIRLDGNLARLTPAGVEMRRETDRQQTLVMEEIEVDGARALALVNGEESPLAALARRRDRNGRPFLCADEFAAGERLRSDYTRGQIMPRLGANWHAAVASGRRDGAAGGNAELTEAALSARIRVDRAIEAVGPELAGVLVDICCFLKGLETVETERGWPVRSAKVVLKTALGALARHYRPPAGSQAKAKPILHWGAEGYRPRIS